MNPNEYCRLFSFLFPSTNSESSSGRFEAFMEIAARKEFDLSNKDNLSLIKRKSNILTRAGLKKFFDGLRELKLIEKDGPDVIITAKGLMVYNKFNDLFRKEAQKDNCKEKIRFKSLIVYIDTSIDRQTALWNWTLFNSSGEPINSYVHYLINSERGKEGEDIILNNSKNIKEIKKLQSDEFLTSFEIIFNKPIKENEKLSYWYKYAVPNNSCYYSDTEQPWIFFVSPKKYPIDECIVIFKLNETHKMDEKSLKILEIPKKSDSEFDFIEPLLVPNQGSQELIFKMKNLKPGVVYKILWNLK